MATIGRSPIAPTETAVERRLDFVETEGLLVKQKSTIKTGFPKQYPSLATLDSVSAAASVGAVALQRCPPDTRTLYTRGPHYALINSLLQTPICLLKSKQALQKLNFRAFAELVFFLVLMNNE